jgi:hypothetical protein
MKLPIEKSKKVVNNPKKFKRQTPADVSPADTSEYPKENKNANNAELSKQKSTIAMPIEKSRPLGSKNKKIKANTNFPGQAQTSYDLGDDFKGKTMKQIKQERKDFYSSRGKK